MSCFLFPAEAEQGACLPSGVRTPGVNKDPLCDMFTVILFELWGFLLIILLFRMVPKHSAEALSQVPECKKAALCLTEKYMY